MKNYILTYLILIPTPVLALSTQESWAIGLFGGCTLIIGGLFGASYYKPFFISTSVRISRAVREGFIRDAAIANQDIPLNVLPSSSSLPPINIENVPQVVQAIVEHAPVVTAVLGT